MNKFTLALFLVAVFNVAAFAQKTQVTEAFGADTLFVIHTESARDLADAIESTGIITNSRFQSLVQEIDGMVANRLGDEQDDADQESWAQDLYEQFIEIVGEGSVTIGGFPNSNGLDAVLIGESGGVTQDVLLEQLAELREHAHVLVEIVEPAIARHEPFSDEWSDEKEDVFRFDLAPHLPNKLSLYCVLTDDHVVLATSHEVAKSIAAGLNQPTADNLTTDRMFMATVNKMESSKADGNMWVYLNPRLINRYYSIDESIMFRTFLPEFWSDFGGVSASNEIAGIGIRMQIFQPDSDDKLSQQSDDDEQTRQPAVLLDGFVRTALPRTGVLSVLETTQPVQFPPFEYGEGQLDYLTMQNFDFEKMFEALKKSYTVMNPDSTWEQEDERLKVYRKHTYHYQELYSKIGHSRTVINFRSTNAREHRTYRFLQLKDSDSAKWFAEQKSKSTYLNQNYPFTKYQIGDITVFKRAADSSKQVAEKFGSNSDKFAYVAAGNWIVTCSPVRVDEVAEAFGYQPKIPSVVGELIEGTKQTAGVANEPFYLHFHSYGRWWSTLYSSQRALVFDREFGHRPGFSHQYAPKTFAERLFMTAHHRARHAFFEEMGDTLLLITMDRDSIRFTVGCFEPGEKERWDHDIPKLEDYVPPAKKKPTK